MPDNDPADRRLTDHLYGGDGNDLLLFMAVLIASIIFYSNYSLFFIAMAYMLSGVLARVAGRCS